MSRPTFRDIVYEAFFVGGYLAAEKNGRLDSELVNRNIEFFRSLDQGRPLVDFCHLIETYYGDREKFIANLKDPTLGPVVRLIFFARNAFIHCGWKVDEMDRQNQKDALRKAAQQTPIHPAAPNFTLAIDNDGRLAVRGLQSICQSIADAVP